MNIIKSIKIHGSKETIELIIMRIAKYLIGADTLNAKYKNRFYSEKEV